MLQRQLSSCDIPVFTKKKCCGDRIVSPQDVARNLAGWNSRVMLRGQNEPNVQCRLVCTAVANCPRYKIARINKNVPLKLVSDFCEFYASIRLVCTGLRTVPATCANAVHTKGLVLATCPCNMSPSVCRPYALVQLASYFPCKSGGSNGSFSPAPPPTPYTAELS